MAIVQVMESINLTTNVVTNIPMTGAAHSEILSATWDAVNGRFIVGDLNGMFTVTTGGVFTFLSASTTISFKGLAFNRVLMVRTCYLIQIAHTNAPRAACRLQSMRQSELQMPIEAEDPCQSHCPTYTLVPEKNEEVRDSSNHSHAPFPYLML